MLLEQIDGYEFNIAEKETELIESRRVHHDVFLSIGYIDHAYPTGMIEDIFVEMSWYYYCRHLETGQVVGVVRQINGSLLGLPTLNDFSIWTESKSSIAVIPWTRIVEIGSLAVLKEHKCIVEGLYRQIWQRSKTIMHSHWVASIDNRLLAAFRKYRGFLWEDIGDTKLYMGSLTTPVIADLDAQSRNMAKLSHKFYEYINESKPSEVFGKYKV